MGALKATPGPWIVTGDLQDGYLRIRDAVSEEVLATMDDGGHCDPQFAIDDAIIEANAHLIAAAPKMYAKLEIAAAIFEEYARIHLAKCTLEANAKAKRNMEYALEMRATLAEARGESLLVEQGDAK